MRRSLFTLIAVAALSTGAAAGAQPQQVVSHTGYARSIVPNVGIGGVTLGESLSDVHRMLGQAQTVGDADSGLGEYWRWGLPPDGQMGPPADALTVEYAWVDGKPGPASLLQTPGAWTIAGTNIVSGTRGNVAELRRYYGKRLLGPYVVGPSTGKGHSSLAYYELPGRYLGRRVHTLFASTTYRSDADEFLGVSVSFCVKKALFRSVFDIPCH